MLVLFNMFVKYLEKDLKQFPAIWSFEELTASGGEMLQQKSFVPGGIRYLCKGHLVFAIL